MTWIIAHRGGFYEGIKENTLEAFEKAIEIGVDFIEFDVHQTKDRKLAVIHDHEIHEKKIAEMTYDELLLETAKEGFTAPLLSDVLNLAKGRIKCDIEIKSAGYEKEIVEMVKSKLNYEQFTMKSFLDEVPKKIKEIDENIKTGLLIGLEHPKNLIATRLYEIFSLERRIKDTGIDFVCPHFDFTKVFFIPRIKRMQKPFTIWTVNDEKIINKLLGKEVAGIITNNPEMVLKLRNSMAKTLY
jgi:glycerophosphoryl diester phosphodiesterase